MGMAVRQVLVKVGDGLWSLVKIDLIAADRMSLLEALAGTRAFDVKLRDVALDECTVLVCASASDEEPSEAEARSALELKGAKPLSALAASLVGSLFIHVLLPAPTAAGAGAGGESRHFEAAAAQHARGHAHLSLLVRHGGAPSH